MDAELVAAARSGSAEAMDELVGCCLPLVYNIVGRALSGRADVDDVVQETMLRVVRGLPGLRDDEAFRSWLVAVTMNQIRRHHAAGPAAPRALDELDELSAVADPGADFTDLTLTELGLSGQRRETVEATLWLDPDDRELLSLWWLVTAGHLARTDLVAALGLDSHHVTVRVSRMKAQLDAARLIVRALASRPRCAELEAALTVWDGRPSALWRKRLARHVRACADCGALGTDLVPAERLLVNFALLPLPLGYAAYMLTRLGLPHISGSALVNTAQMTPAQASATASGSGPASGSGRAAGSSRTPSGPVSHRRGRSVGTFGGKPLLVAAGVTAGVVAAVGAGVLALSSGNGHAADATGQPAAAISGVLPSASTALPSPTIAPTRKPVASASPTGARPSPTHSSATPRSASASAAAPSAAAPPPTLSPDQAAVQQVLAVINQARAGQGLAPLQLSSGLESSSGAHNQTMAAGCGLQHQCPGEASLGARETAAGVQWSAAGENIGTGGPVSDTTSGVAGMAVGLTRSMLAEQPPNDGHRKNILSTAFHHIGIAVMRDSNGNVWLTQDFSD
ncbi:sigma-70 family RNA polymerase sigma factor [Streptacidiphilus sp. NEAU-YB345]|uniref:Sigma-70 family RNA polymerase sigma factor n=2 Tax=Streptacidiphilus fuscans TaxID=2789292 RepID=A0A931BEQ5_9ACTN|nr:sigma-70 family RNA polymerase sigma factor [Streptacidiphilus fuscans]